MGEGAGMPARVHVCVHRDGAMTVAAARRRTAGGGWALTSLRAGSPKTAHARTPMRVASRSVVRSSPTRVGRRLCRQQSHGRLSSSPRAASESGARDLVSGGGKRKGGGGESRGEGGTARESRWGDTPGEGGARTCVDPVGEIVLVRDGRRHQQESQDGHQQVGHAHKVV